MQTGKDCRRGGTGFQHGSEAAGKIKGGCDGGALQNGRAKLAGQLGAGGSSVGARSRALVQDSCRQKKSISASSYQQLSRLMAKMKMFREKKQTPSWRVRMRILSINGC